MPSTVLGAEGTWQWGKKTKVGALLKVPVSRKGLFFLFFGGAGGEKCLFWELLCCQSTSENSS